MIDLAALREAMEAAGLKLPLRKGGQIYGQTDIVDADGFVVMVVYTVNADWALSFNALPGLIDALELKQAALEQCEANWSSLGDVDWFVKARNAALTQK